MKKKNKVTHQPLALVGNRIRQMRKQNGVTLSELAASCSITVAYLSQIERNLAEPSLPVLRRIARELKTEMSMFFVDEVHTDVLITRSDDEVLTDIAALRYRFMMPSRLAGGKRSDMSVMIAYIEPQSMENAESITHRGAEFTTVISGELRYLIGEEEFVLQEGDSIYVEGQVAHKVYNLSDQESRCLSAIELV